MIDNTKFIPFLIFYFIEKLSFFQVCQEICRLFLYVWESIPFLILFAIRVADFPI